MEDVFYSKGLHFSCTKCSDCCRLSPGVVYLSRQDLTKLCQWFKFTEEEFIKIYCRWVMYTDGEEVLSLRETPAYDCILWRKDKGCAAYGARPVQCSTYPFWSWMLESRKTWDECKKDCPGINEGTLWSRAEIEKEKAAYDSIEPLHRKDIKNITEPKK